MKDQTISIQLGPFSNFVGTHLWNLREVNGCENEGSLYRLNGQKSYPRVLAIDFRDNIHPINAPRSEESILDPTKNSSFWSSSVDVHHQQSSTGSGAPEYDDT